MIKTVSIDVLEDLKTRCESFQENLKSANIAALVDKEKLIQAVCKHHKEISHIIDLADKHGIIERKGMEGANLFVSGDDLEITAAEGGKKNQKWVPKIYSADGRSFKPVGHFQQAANHLISHIDNILTGDPCSQKYKRLDYASRQFQQAVREGLPDELMERVELKNNGIPPDVWKTEIIEKKLEHQSGLA